MNDDDDGKVARPFELSTRPGKHCGHWTPVVCAEERAVTCRACGATLDPITVLVRMAQHRERLVFEGKHLKNEINSLRVCRDELKRETRNLKARIRRHAPAEAEPVPPPAPENVVPIHHRKARR